MTDTRPKASRQAVEGFADSPDDGVVPDDFVPMTAEQARAWRQAHPVVSPWRVVVLQALVGLLASLVTWAWLGGSVALSLAYGAMCAVLPASLLARAVTRRVAGSPASAVLSFFLGEAAKLGLTLAMLFAAPRIVGVLSWPALLIGLVLTMKVYWLVPALRKTVR
jgi:ATP synthase protein I